jgi:N-acetylglucosaminyl-diphospho-decaprenol L-rhamnosyltransferase
VWPAPKNLVLISYNEFMKTIKEDLAVILNNDMKVNENFILPLVKYFGKKDTFFVSPKHMSFDGKEYQGGKNKFTGRLGFLSASPDYPGFEKDIDISSPNLFTGNGAFDVKIFNKLGGFDPLYLPGGMEDTDLCYRAWESGYKGWYEPESVLYHIGSASFKKMFSPAGRHINNYRNSFLFAWKNTGPAALAALLALLPFTLVIFLLTGRFYHLLGFFSALAKLPAVRRRPGRGIPFSIIKKTVDKKYPLPVFFDGMADRDLSIVIPAYNRKNELISLIGSLLSQGYDRKKVEIIVSDDGSTDNTGRSLAALLKRHKELKYIYNPNSGPAAARNAGIRAARGRVIGFLDSDVIADKNLIRSVLKEFKSGVRALEGMTLKTGGVPETVFTHSVENKKAGRWITCNLFILKKVLHEVGGFDEAFRHPIREDTDIGFAMLENNYRPVFFQKAVVYHPVYTSGYNKFFKLAYYGIYEPLLFAKYPGYYLNHLKWFDSWFFPVYYLGYYTLPFFLFVGSPQPLLSRTGVLLFILSYAVSVYSVFRKKIFDIKGFIVTAFLFLFIPYIRLFWIFAGLIRLLFR